MAYDPQACGADCASCWLYTRRAGGPVPPELTASDTILVGEAPGKDECQLGRPFVGESGHELFVSLGTRGVRRADVALTNALLCRPDGNELERMKNARESENRRRKKLNERLGPGEEPWALFPDPVDCCRPRLLRELARYRNVVLLGNTALRSITAYKSIMAMRGTRLEGFLSPHPEFGGFTDADLGFKNAGPDAAPVRILPTLHPAMVLRQRKWTEPFRGDLGRAVRWFKGTVDWKDPTVILKPTLAQVQKFLRARPALFGWDLETDSKYPLLANIRCFGVGTMDIVMVVPFLSTDGITRFYPSADLEAIKHEFREWLEQSPVLKAGWNSGIYDRTVVEQQLGVKKIKKHFDGIIAHHCTDSEMPHSLGYAGTTMTDVTAWKQDSSDPLKVSDPVLWERNWKDVIVTARLVPKLSERLELRDQITVCKNDMRAQEICHGMHRVGMLVDPVARDKHDRYYLGEIVKHRRTMQEIVGATSFNPGSTAQVSEILFEKWGLPPVEISETTGKASTGDDVLREYLVKHNLSKAQKTFIASLRRYRLAIKFRGTNILKLRPMGETVPEDDYALDVEETPEEREYRRAKDLKKQGILYPDGRVRTSWKNHVAVSGRFSSSDPAMQNIKRKLRDMYIAAPGHVLVGADMDQLELRFAAALWKMDRLLEIFKDPTRDPHTETAMAIFGEAAAQQLAIAQAWAAEKGPDGKPLLDAQGKARKVKKHPGFERVRDFSKRLRYAVQYGAEDDTVHDVIASVEDDDGRLLYANVSVQETRSRRRALLDLDPYEAAWEATMRDLKRDGYLAEPIWGRRRYFENGQEFNEATNFRIQAGSSAVVNDATFDLLQEIPFEKWGPGTGLIHQGHDALVLEVPESEGKRTAEILVRCMTRRYKGLDVDFKAEAKIGRHWGEV